jgi:hypothetical protein
MEYVLDNRRYILSYQELKEEYDKFSGMSDEEFTQNLPAAAHLACVICFLKEVPTYICLSDIGIVHELIHLIHIPEGNTTSLKEIRKQFELWLKLA